MNMRVLMVRRLLQVPDIAFRRSAAVPMVGAMRLSALPSVLAVCLALASLQAATAQPSITPYILATASGGGNVDTNSVTVLCNVSNPNWSANNNPTAPAPTGNVYFVGVSRCFW